MILYAGSCFLPTRAKEWLTKGAQPSDTVRHVLKLAGIETKPSKKQIAGPKKKPKHVHVPVAAKA